MKFSICIPNFNYEAYIEKTIQSVLDQTFQDFEILVSDNNSTDKSVQIVDGFNDTRIKLQVNKNNVGFAGNLLKAASMASGDYMLMLSSDDLMLPTALETYAKILESLGEKAQKVILSSKANTVDSQGQPIGQLEMDYKLWFNSVKEDQLSDLVDKNVYFLASGTLLQNSFLLMRNPFHFLTTLYPKSLHDKVESYYHGSLINPDKRFHWELLGVSENAYFVDESLFCYRVHNQNQGSQQAKMGAIKHHIDEYVATINIQDYLLKKANITRQQLIEAFIEQDIGLRGLKFLAEGNSSLARRIVNFGLSTYPQPAKSNTKILMLRLLLSLGFIGELIAKRSLDIGLQYWKEQVKNNFNH